MEYIESLLANQSFPLLTAVLLGVVLAFAPCIMATNITMIGFIGKNKSQKSEIFWNGCIYIAGKMITYTVLGVIIIFALRKGISVIPFKLIQEYGLICLAPILVLMGLFILFGDKLNLKDFGFKGGGEKLKNRGRWGSLCLGMLFALAFCPTCGLVYFGMLIPLSVAVSEGYVLPLVFSLGAAVPAVIVAWLVAFGIDKINRFYTNIQKVEKWLKLIFGILFILVGIYYSLEYFEVF